MTGDRRARNVPSFPLLVFAASAGLFFSAVPCRPSDRLAPAVSLVAQGDVGEPGRFGLTELEAVVEAGIAVEPGGTIVAEIRPGSFGAAESYSISHVPGGLEVAGSDSRGLMYGLLEVARRLARTRGAAPPPRLAAAVPEDSGRPGTPVRGMIQFLHNEALERLWYHDPAYWDRYLSMLARCRFNTFNLVFAHQTGYLAPPYPFLFSVDAYPGVRARNLAESDRERNLATLRMISRTCRRRGIDFVMGIWQHRAWKRGQPDGVEGLTDENILDYSRMAIEKLLRLCPDITGVQLRVNEESGIERSRQLEFYRDGVMAGMKAAGRPVLLDLRGWGALPGTIEAALDSGLPMRLSVKYWAEFMGMPYQAAQMLPSYSFGDFLSYPHRFPVLYQVWSLGSHRLLPWGSVDWMRRFVPTVRLGDGTGFETCAPLSQKGFGNAPGAWPIFPDETREYYRWEFERYWLYYLLYGRLSYDPNAPPDVWMDEFRARFGAAADPVYEAFQTSGGIIPFLSSYRLSNPNMYIWPEKQSGGVLDFYIETKPADETRFASFEEYSAWRTQGRRSAKMMPAEAAARLRRMADETENALERAAAAVDRSNREFAANRVDLGVLAHLASYQARKVLAGAHLDLYYRTGDTAALRTARSQAAAGLEIWNRLVRLTEDVYHPQMIFGPLDVGHWKDNLPFVRHDVARLDEVDALFERYGLFDLGVDFGPAATPRKSAYQPEYANSYSVERRFKLLDGSMPYDPGRGYGWREPRNIRASEPMRIPYSSLEGDSLEDLQLPSGVLFRDFLRSSEAATLLVDLPAGEYRVTAIVSNQPEVAAGPFQIRSGAASIPYGSGETGDKWMDVSVSDGPLVLDFLPEPGNEWLVSGMVIARRAPHIAHAPFPSVSPGSLTNLHFTITAPDGVGGATLGYGIKGRKPASLALAGYREDFVAELRWPRGWNGREVLYHVTAVDRRGRTSRWPAARDQVLLVGEDRDPPVVSHAPPAGCRPGTPLTLRFEAKDRSTISLARLKYRHLTQLEQYRSIDLAFFLGKAEAVIPGDFIDPRYDLQYYVEVADRYGNGAIHPDPDRAAPYHVVRVERPESSR